MTMRTSFRVVLLAVAACASHPPAAAPPTVALPTPADAAPAVVAAKPVPGACLPAMDAPAITVLDADAQTIHTCIASTCFAIDRASGAIAPWKAWTIPRPIPHRAPSPTTIAKSAAKQHLDICVGDRGCVTVSSTALDAGLAPLAGDIDASQTVAVVTLPGAALTDPPSFSIYSENAPQRLANIRIGDDNRCGHPLLLDQAVFIATDDCDGGNAHGYFFDTAGHRLAQLGGNRPLDAFGAYPVKLALKTWALVAPRAPAIVVVDLSLAHPQGAIDLAPIATAGAAPDFTLARATDDEWLVASPSGGVGVLDLAALRLSSSWIIPPCEPAP